MGETYGVFDEGAILEELRLLQLQVEFSKKCRKAREKEKALASAQAASVQASLAASAHSASDAVSVASGDTLTSTSHSATASTVGQISIKKKKSVQTKGVLDAEGGAGGGPANAAEVRRQREVDAVKRKEQVEAEAEARKEALKSSPAQEKGGWIEVFDKQLMGWKPKKVFVVIRSKGIFLYSKEVTGRGSTSGGVTYDASAKESEIVPFEVTVTNNRGTSKQHKSQVTGSMRPDDHPAVAKGKHLLGVSYYHKDQYAWRVFNCASAAERDSWVEFAARFLKERK